VTEQSRQALIDTAIEMNGAGLNQGASGNLSLRCEGGMLITPSGMEYTSLRPEDIVFMNEQGEAVNRPGGIARKPSSEWPFHLDIYRHRPDAAAVLHAHPVFCSTLACLRKPIPAFHYMVARAGGTDIRCSSYATFGTRELSTQALQALRGRKACLLANHGLLCLEHSLSSALALALEVEHLARTYWQCLAVGEPAILDEEEMERVLEKFRYYGDGAQD
jgi:L-fuculose-phosphate aldolase